MTPEETQKELLNRFKDFGTKLDEANKIAINQEEERLQRGKDKRSENVWYGFALALVKNKFTNLEDIPQRADDLTDSFILRFPNELN